MSRGKSPNKTYVFIDVANLIYGAKRTGKWKVDYKKFTNYLRTRYNASEIFFYAGVSSLENNQYVWLKDIKITLRLKQVKKYLRLPFKKNIICPKCSYAFTKEFNRLPEIKANCDVDLTFDAMKFLSEYSTMILVSGDGDFYPLVKFLMEKGRKVLIIGESSSTAISLKKLMKGSFIDLISIKPIIKF